jgi:hypothetical protein
VRKSHAGNAAVSPEKPGIDRGDKGIAAHAVQQKPALSAEINAAIPAAAARQLDSLDLTDPAELSEVIEILVDAMRRADPDYVLTHGCEPCTDDDWDTAIEAGEDALEAMREANF